MEEPIPTRFKMPQLESYGGTIDPMDHLESYKALLMIQDIMNALLCLAFLATLWKVIQVW